jgi:hypothetical protein
MGVEETSLDHFLKVASSIGIFRVKGADGSVISDTAIQYIGRPFDFEFILEDDSKVYCTELLYLSLKAAKFEHILSTVWADKVNQNVIPMDSVSNNPAIDELAYIVDQNGQVIDEENQAVLRRDNPVKVSFLGRMIALLGRIRKSR